MIAPRRSRFFAPVASCALMFAGAAVAQTHRAVKPPVRPSHTAPATAGSLLDRLPRLGTGGYSAALAAAQARGPAGHDDVLWLELFYGDPAAKAQAEAALRPTGAATTARADSPELAFLQFLAAYNQGQDRQMLRSALDMTQLAPNDVATELAVRALSGQLETQGRELLDAVPTIERVLGEPIADPATSYMLGRSLLAAVHAPGLTLTEANALQLAGRLPHWQLWGPFGKWQNLDFDHVFPIENAAAATYTDDTDDQHVRRPQPFENTGDAIPFPVDWNGQGVDFAVTYVHANAATPVLVRLYSAASAQMEINGASLIRNDRRSSYTPATQVAAFTLPAGWNRIVVKLTGEASRDFDLMLRPAAGASAGALTDAASLPGGAALAAAPRPGAEPISLAAWSAHRLAADAKDSVALWVDGIRRMQDEDAETALVSLQQASQLAPNSASVWLALSDTYTQLAHASQSWAASQTEAAAQRALKADPHAVRAYDRLGHVYESEGKPTQAAEQLAQCADKGYADCDWSVFHLAAGQRWLPEAETALGHALAESGSDWNGIVSGLEFYSSVGDAANVTRWEQVLQADPRAAAALGSYELRQGHAAAAATYFHTAIGFAPSSPEIRRSDLEALLLSGDHAQAEAQAKTALTDFPSDWRIAEEADEIGLRQDLAQGVAALRATDFDRNLLRHQADFLAHDKFWQPWYHSAAEILKGAPGKSEYPNASSILVFDQMVNRINPDSSQDQYIHQIYRMLNAAGIAQFGDVTTITRGSDLITIRTIKQDGQMLLPEKIANITSISMPGLEAGDYIEIEFVQHTPPSSVLPGSLDNSEFFVFNSSKQPYHYSDYIVLTPPHYPLLVDQERFPAQPAVSTLPDGYTAREWLVQKTRILVTEPSMPPEQNLVPKVWVSSQLSWDDIAHYLADHTYSVQRVTEDMRHQAETLTAGQSTDVAKADAIFNWVAANIQPGDGSPLTPARQYFADRSGNRIAVFLGMLSSIKIPYQIAFGRFYTDDSSTKIPSLFQFQYPLIHVGELSTAQPDSPTGWYDLNNDFAQVGYIVPAVRGGEAIVASTADNSGFIHLPQFSSTLDGAVVTVTGALADSGDATIHLDIEFRGPNGEQVRQALANQPASSLPQIYQQLLLGSYPNATSTGGKIINQTDKQKPLIISIDATVPSLVHMDSAGSPTNWDIENLIAPVGLLARYAPLPTRDEPLVIAGESYEQSKVTLTLPSRFGGAALPAPAKLDNQFGSFSSAFSQTRTQSGDTIQFSRLLDLKSNLIQPANYPAFRDFGEAVDNQDRLRLTGTGGGQ